MNLRPMILTSVAIVAGMLLASAWAWVQLPADAQVPIHWGADGQPDDWASKTVGLLLLPAVAAGVATLLALIPRYEPRRANLERSATAYGAIWIGVMLMLGGMHLMAVGAAMGIEVDMTRFALVATGALFVVIGNYLPKVRPNYMVGIRTPWTLASDRSWTRTHRVGGRLFVIEGVALALLGLVGMTGVAIVAALLWRHRDPAGRDLRHLLPGLEGGSGEARAMTTNEIILLAVPVLVIQIGLIVLALRDLLKPERRVRGDSKLMWGVIIVVINLIGPILYFVVGRDEG